MIKYYNHEIHTQFRLFTLAAAEHPGVRGTASECGGECTTVRGVGAQKATTNWLNRSTWKGIRRAIGLVSQSATNSTHSLRCCT